MPLTISTSPESGPESSASLLPSLDDLPTLQEMLGLPDRESSLEEMDDDGNNGPEHLFFGYPANQLAVAKMEKDEEEGEVMVLGLTGTSKPPQDQASHTCFLCRSSFSSRTPSRYISCLLQNQGLYNLDGISTFRVEVYACQGSDFFGSRTPCSPTWIPCLKKPHSGEVFYGSWHWLK